MKKLLFILGLAALCLAGFSQRGKWIDSIPGALTGTDTVVYQQFWSGGTFSGHMNYRSLDNTDGTIGIYVSNFHPDSNIYEPVWIDLNLDGSNDNPKTMSDSAWFVSAEVGPARWIFIKYTKGSNTAGQTYYDFRKQ